MFRERERTGERKASMLLCREIGKSKQEREK